MSSNSKQEKSTAGSKLSTIIGAILCIILIPILVINVTLIVKSYTNKDEVPKLGGYCPLIVLTGSMEPMIQSGDLIIVKQIETANIVNGDVIAFFDPDSKNNSVLTHRIVETVNEDGVISYRTKGDANNAEDSSLVPADKVVGIYKTRIPNAGNVAMFMQTTPGLIVCVVLPLILLVGIDVIRRRKLDKANQEDTAALLAELEALKAAKAAQTTKEDEE